MQIFRNGLYKFTLAYAQAKITTEIAPEAFSSADTNDQTARDSFNAA